MYLNLEDDPRQIADEKAITVKINNADFDREVAYDLFDDMYKDEIYDVLIKLFPDNLRQAFIDDMDNKELFADLIMESVKLRNHYRSELEELLND